MLKTITTCYHMRLSVQYNIDSDTDARTHTRNDTIRNNKKKSANSLGV